MGTKPNTGFNNRWSVPADLVGGRTHNNGSSCCTIERGVHTLHVCSPLTTIGDTAPANAAAEPPTPLSLLHRGVKRGRGTGGVLEGGEGGEGER